MATPLDRRYRNRLDQIRRAVAARITALYGSTVSGGVQQRTVRLSDIPINDDGRVPLSEAIVQRTMQDISNAPPIRLDSSGGLIDGRHRIEAASRLGITSLPAIVGDVDLDDAFGRLFPAAAGIVAAGQSQARATASGYLLALITLGAGRTAALPVLSLPTISDIAKRMDAWPAMVKGQIGEGRSLIEALDTGRYLAERFADREVVGTVDAQTELATKTGQFRGWEGDVSGDSCDPCQGNAGFHDIDEPMYRHGSCQCDRTWVVAD